MGKKATAMWVKQQPLRSDPSQHRFQHPKCVHTMMAPITITVCQSMIISQSSYAAAQKYRSFLWPVQIFIHPDSTAMSLSRTREDDPQTLLRAVSLEGLFSRRIGQQNVHSHWKWTFWKTLFGNWVLAFSLCSVTLLRWGFSLAWCRVRRHLFLFARRFRAVVDVAKLALASLLTGLFTYLRIRSYCPTMLMKRTGFKNKGGK